MHGLLQRQLLARQHQAALRLCTGGMVQTRASSRAGGARQTSGSASAPGRAPAQGAPPSDALFDDVHNFRDISSASDAIAPGRVFRCAAPINASPHDIDALYKTLGIRELIDLRSSDELAMFERSMPPVFAGVSFCKYTRDYATRRAVPDPLATVMTDNPVTRVHIAPLEKRRLYRSIIARMPLRTAATIVGTMLINKDAGRAMAVEEVNARGLEGLYEILIDGSKQEWVAALQRILHAAEQRKAALFFCKAGKDRTGILAALLLSILGASDAQIVADYHASDSWHHVALAGLENDSRMAKLDRAKFERAPAEAMRHALDYIRRDAGSVEGYLLGAGLSEDEMDRLRRVLLKPGRGGGSGGGGSGGDGGSGSGAGGVPFAKL